METLKQWWERKKAREAEDEARRRRSDDNARSRDDDTPSFSIPSPSSGTYRLLRLDLPSSIDPGGGSSGGGGFSGDSVKMVLETVLKDAVANAMGATIAEEVQ